MTPSSADLATVVRPQNNPKIPLFSCMHAIASFPIYAGLRPSFSRLQYEKRFFFFTWYEKKAAECSLRMRLHAYSLGHFGPEPAKDQKPLPQFNWLEFWGGKLE